MYYFRGTFNCTLMIANPALLGKYFFFFKGNYILKSHKKVSEANYTHPSMLLARKYKKSMG